MGCNKSCKRGFVTWPMYKTYLYKQLSEFWCSIFQRWYISFLLSLRIKWILGGNLADKLSQVWLAACHRLAGIWWHLWASERWSTGALLYGNERTFASSQITNATESLYPRNILTMLVRPMPFSTHNSRYLIVNKLNLCLIVNFTLLSRGE